MNKLIFFFFIICLFIPGCNSGDNNPSDTNTKERAISLAKEIIIIDTHIDTPYRLRKSPADITQKLSAGNFDLPRAIEGGLNCAFFSIYTDPSLEDKGLSKMVADSLLDLTEQIVRNHGDKFAFALSPEDVENNFKQRRFSIALGMENGSPIEGDLANVKYFYDRGIRYIGLAHSRSNHLADASFDKKRLWQGLSPFGEEVIREMNRLGIMIDVSHLSDSAFYDVIRISKAPVIASHSSCRHFTPGWERNISDEMIIALAKTGGVVQINFGSSFLREDYRQNMRGAYPTLRKNKWGWDSKEAQQFMKEYREKHNIPLATTKDVADHIDHVVSLVGIDHVGLGSDFDGLGETLPSDLRDVSMYPNLIEELLKRGYTETDIRKICGQNLLRVWKEVEKVKSK
ncbi:MAG: dipeptidase [Calditrichia bacterium]